MLMKPKKRKTPNLEQVKAKFADAKVIRCLKTKIEIDVSNVVNFYFNGEKKQWTSVGGTVVFWRNFKFAPIKIFKSGNKNCKCTNCKCNEEN